MDKIHQMWGIFMWEKVLTEDKRRGLSDICEISYAVWQWDMVLVCEGEGGVSSEANLGI